jgi:hypothetical protein
MASATLSRRAALSGALALPLAAGLPALIAPRLNIPPMPAEWLDICAQVQAIHKNGLAAAHHAYRLGMRADDWTGTMNRSDAVDPADLPLLMFGDWRRPGFLLVSPRKSGAWEAFT